MHHVTRLTRFGNDMQAQIIRCTDCQEIIKTLSMFLKEVSFVHQGCIYLIKNTVKNYEILL